MQDFKSDDFLLFYIFQDVITDLQCLPECILDQAQDQVEVHTCANSKSEAFNCIVQEVWVEKHSRSQHCQKPDKAKFSFGYSFSQ